MHAVTMTLMSFVAIPTLSMAQVPQDVVDFYQKTYADDCSFVDDAMSRAINLLAEDGGDIALYRIPCHQGAYNISDVFIRYNLQSQEVNGLFFSKPKVDENGEVLEVKEMPYLVNGTFEREQQQFIESVLWRGLGDAFQINTYTYSPKSGQPPHLVHSEVDHTFDGAMNPQTIVDESGDN